jgi:16S rRNA (uracil1498-N3)-methyltransferase
MLLLAINLHYIVKFMRTIRLFHPGIYQVPETISLNENAAHHAAVVLRLKPGDNITLFNGNNEEFDATIVAINKKSVQVSLSAKRPVDRESPCKIHLGQAIIKGDRMEWLIQKAVEMGVFQITPLLSEHAAVRYDDKRLSKKMAQWQGIIIAACEQCGRNRLPMLNAPQSTHDWFANTPDNPLILLPGAERGIKQLPASGHHCLTIAIGPEGGWSCEEENIAKAHQWQAIGLGPRILRAETAALCALTLLQGAFGDI